MKHLPAPERKYLWIGIALLLKVIILGYFLWQSYEISPWRIVGGVAVKQNDYGFFLGVIDNYFDTGTMMYVPGRPYAGRMPGYGLPYMLLRYVMPSAGALAMLIILQVLLSAIAVYSLALTAMRWLKNKRAFYIAYFLFAISTYTSIFDIFTLSESFSVSCFIFLLFYLTRWKETRRNSDIFLAGFFMAWMIFLRPFLGIFLLFVPLALFVWVYRKESLRNAIAKAALLVLPFIIFETAWVARNYIVLHKFIPLETNAEESYGKGGVYRTGTLSVRDLINAWGGESGEFYENSEAWWFHYAKGEEVRAYKFEPHVFNADYNLDSLIYLKNMIGNLYDPNIPEAKRDSISRVAEITAYRYRESYIRHNKARYYLLGPVIKIKKLVFSNPTLQLPLPRFQQMSRVQKVAKLFYIVLYYIVICIGLLGALLALVKREWHLLFLAALPVVLVITLMSFSYMIYENRYILSAYPVFIILASRVLINIPKRKAGRAA
jgi:4-amino-4-deoxy-L-arabinose transferase-like glycosyltransferase